MVEDLNNNSQLDAGERTSWYHLDAGQKFIGAPAALPGGGTSRVSLSLPRTVDGMPSIIFRRDGAASSDLQAYLSGPAGTTTARAISVVRATGRTEWFRYDGAGWKQGGA